MRSSVLLVLLGIAMVANGCGGSSRGGGGGAGGATGAGGMGGGPACSSATGAGSGTTCNVVEAGGACVTLNLPGGRKERICATPNINTKIAETAEREHIERVLSSPSSPSGRLKEVPTLAVFVPSGHYRIVGPLGKRTLDVP